jgi:hypothetical protein
MPWCEECARYFTPTAMKPDGSCPSCGRVLDVAEPITAKNLDIHQLAGESGNTPWHFKLLMVLLTIYLAYRLVDLVFL